MPRLSTRIQVAPLGTRNPANPGRAPVPTIKLRGSAFPVEQFSSDALEPNTQRALIQVQRNVAQAFGQVRSSPFAYANIVRGVKLVQGGANGTLPTPIAHGLDVDPSGYAILNTQGGYVTAHALVSSPSPKLIQVWAQWTAFAGVTQVTADVLIFA